MAKHRPVTVEVPADVEVIELAVGPARRALEAAFVAVGAGDEEAHRVVDAVIEAELSEVPTHGFLRVPWYLDALRSGTVAPAGPTEVVTSNGATAVIDGGGAYGYLPTWRAAELAAELAGRAGVAAVGVRSIAEFGRAAYYTDALASRGLLGIACQNTIPLLAAPGSDRATHGNNPLAYSAPGSSGPVFDAAFTRRSGGELRRRAMLGLPLPLDWGYLDAAGTPTTDPQQAAASVQQAVGGAKGFGLAVLVDLLAGALTGSATSIDVPVGGSATGAMVIAIDPRALGVDAPVMDSALGRAAEAVRSSGGRWPGDRSRSAHAAGALRRTLLVPAPILDAAVAVVGAPLRDAIVAVR